MTNDEKIAALEQEIKALKERVTDIFDALKLEAESSTENFGKVYALITEIIHYVMPVVHKVFPGIARGQREIDAFLKQRPPSSGSKKTD